MKLIPEDLVIALVNYLAGQKWIEVNKFLQGLAQLQEAPKPEPKPEPKE